MEINWIKSKGAGIFLNDLHNIGLMAASEKWDNVSTGLNGQ